MGSSPRPARPTPRLLKLNAAVNKALQSAELRANLAKLGIEAKSQTPQAFGAGLADDMAKYDEIVRLTGIKVE